MALKNNSVRAAAIDAITAGIKIDDPEFSKVLTHLVENNAMLVEFAKELEVEDEEFNQIVLNIYRGYVASVFKYKKADPVSFAVEKIAESIRRNVIDTVVDKAVNKNYALIKQTAEAALVDAKLQDLMKRADVKPEDIVSSLSVNNRQNSSEYWTIN